MKRLEGKKVFTTKHQAVEPIESIVPKLRELTGALTKDPQTTVFKTVNGRDVPTRNLLSNADVGVVHSVIPEGETFPEHSHSNGIIEYLICYKGRMIVTRRDSGEVSEVLAGGIVMFNPDENHIVGAVSGHGAVHMIAVTVPREPGFPGNER